MLSFFFTLSKSCVYPSLSALKLSLCVIFEDLSLVEVTESMFCLPIASKVGRPRFMNFGLSRRTEFERFTRLLGSKSATILAGRLFTPTFSMHEKSEFLSWVPYPSTEVPNGSMFLDHYMKLELLTRLGLKTYTFTPGVPILLGFRIFLSYDVQLSRMLLSNCMLLHAATVTIAFGIIVFSGYKLFRESSTREFSWTFVTRSCPMTHMTAGSKMIGLTDNLRILSIM